MRHLLRVALVGAAMVMTTAQPSRAQVQIQVQGGEAGRAVGIETYVGAPGATATTWGVASFGVPRTYSRFASPYGPGYAYGYYPYTVLPGYYGARLWRPGFAVPGYVYGSGYYGTASTPYAPLTNGAPPPIGTYAPGFGPPPVPFLWNGF